jgi:hypothetical protein
VLAPGLYHLESITFYDTSDPSCTSTLEDLGLRYSILVVPESTTGGTIQMVLAAANTGVYATIDYVIDGTTMLTNITCGDGSDTTSPFTADATSLTMFSARASTTCGPRADVLRLQ